MVLMILCFYALSGFSQNDKLHPTTTNAQAMDQELSQQINTYVSNNFPQNKVLKHSIVESKMGNTYQVYLDNDVNLGFNDKNEITSIRSTSRIPDASVPPAILKYVQSSFSSNTITSWGWSEKVQVVTLDNGQKLEFNNDGEYIITDK